MQDDIELNELEAVVLEYVSRPKYQPVKPRVIAKKLEIPVEQHTDLKKAIKRLIKKGRLEYGSKHLVKIAKPASEQKPKTAVTGVFRRAAAGFGFVRPAGQTAPDRSEDIFIPAHRTLDAADGDVVAIHMKGKRRFGDDLRWTGDIVEILERDTHQFVGVYEENEGYGVVRVDGRIFAEAVLVGDPGAKNAKPGDKVVIEMVRFPSHTHDGEGVIVEVLGPRGDPAVDTLSILREFSLPEQFEEPVLESAREQADRFDESIGNRHDLTRETTVTIDPVDARDFDDAISLERLEHGHWRLGVHIADVAHFVPEGTALDLEARDRATSVYLPDRVIPMLPEVISNNLASLQPERIRFAKTAWIEFTADGARVAIDLQNSAIRSDRRFTYEEVDEYLADRAAWTEKLAPLVFKLLGEMHELAMILRQRRLSGGAIELTLPEIKIDLDKRGRVAGAHLVEHTESHQIIEEFMLAANEAVADYLHRQELNFLRRIHEQPEPRKLRQLSQFVRDLGVECESLESRFEIKRVVEQVRGRPEEHAVHFAVLRSLKKARYGPEVEGHYALHSEGYCHFTSPIRRYPDLTIHRMINALLNEKRPPDDFDHLALLGEHCSQREQRAESAERELTKIKLLNYLSTRIGEHMDAVITGVEKFGLFAQGTELPADGLIPVNSLVDDYYDYDRNTHSLVGRRGNSFRLGDMIRVEIAHVDVDRRMLNFRLISRQKSRTTKTAALESTRGQRKPKRREKKGKEGSKSRKKR